MKFLIVTGLSGAGKSHVAEYLEDLGYYCVDNMPIELIPKFSEICIASKGIYEKVALVTDVRVGASFDTLIDSVKLLKEMGSDVKIVFVEASLPIIQRRYKETRRPHPLAENGKSIEEAYLMEKKILEKVREHADFLIDTSGFVSTNKLRERVIELFGDQDSNSGLVVTVTSFGYKNGIPPESDLLFDVRFLPNPFYVEELRNLTGLDEPVRNFVLSFEQTHQFLRILYEFMDFVIPGYIEEGKSSLVIGIGCTGGHHRSVVIANELTEHLRNRGVYAIQGHRDLNRR